MVVIGRVQHGVYFDSVTLMRVSHEITEIDGVTDAAVVMGSQDNKALLATAGLLAPGFEEASDTDLLISVQTVGEPAAQAVHKALDAYLARLGKTAAGSDTYHPKSLEGALDRMPDATLAVISVAGRYAYDQAMQALCQGLQPLYALGAVVKRRGSRNEQVETGEPSGIDIVDELSQRIEALVPHITSDALNRLDLIEYKIQSGVPGVAQDRQQSLEETHRSEVIDVALYAYLPFDAGAHVWLAR